MTRSLTTTSTSQSTSRQPFHDIHERTPTSLNGVIPNIHNADQGIPPDARITLPFFADQSYSRPQLTTQEELYSDLSTYKFGAATLPPPSHSYPRNSSYESDEPLNPLSDVTPRPSVSGAVYDPLNELLRPRKRDDTDSASLHTFGAEGERFSSSSASVSVTSLASDVRVTDDFYGSTSATSGFTSAQFSSDEYEEEDMDDVSEHNQSIPFTAVSQGEEWDRSSRLTRSASSTSDLYGQRRGSLPMTIPGATPPIANSFNDNFYGPGRHREDSAATIRRPSRSLDDDLQMFHSGQARMGTGMVGSPGSGLSEPRSRGDWEMLEIKGKGRDRTPHGTERPSVDATADPVAATHGFDADWMKELQGGITTMAIGDVAGFDASAPQPSSPSARRPSGQSWTRWGAGIFGAGRRPSAATIGTLDDPFARQVYRWDGVYGQRRGEWSFKKEKAEEGTAIRAARSSLSTVDSFASPRGSFSTDTGSTNIKEPERVVKPKPSPLNGMPRGTEEIWRCEFVGRYKVHRREVRAKTPSNAIKPPQQRLDIQPFADPYAKVDAPHGMPVTIHKHSRAIAFSIYRQRHRVTSSRRPSSARDGPSAQQSVAPARSSIMLAPKRVQEQYTSTRTTISLDTHGLLENKTPGRSQVPDRDQNREQARKQSVSERERSAAKREKEKKRPKDDDIMFSILGGGKKDKEKKNRVASSSTSQTSSAGSVTGYRDDFCPPPTPAPTRSNRPKDHPTAVRKQTSSKSLRNSSSTSFRTPPLPPPPPSAPSLLSSRSPNPRRPVRESDADDSDIDGQPAHSRTPHSEAFGSMDPNLIVEQMRQRTDYIRSSDDSRQSIFKRFTKPLSRSAGVGPSATIDGSYIPQWRMMAPRSQQEENERVVQILNDSFKGVGLLPSKPPSKSRTPNRRKQSTSGSARVNIFEEVPADSLYMLLPLWPGETCSQSAQESPSPKPRIPPEERQYLLVYYVPFETKPQDGNTRARRDPEKRSRSSQTSSFDESVADEYGVLLNSFHCSGRIVGYSDLHGLGVLAPDEGLFITGPMSEAMAYIPSPSIRQEHQTDFVIAICNSRDHGVEFIPEGLVKMGLCYPTQAPLTEEPTPLPDEDEMPEEPDVKLTPIGRAVVEMAWLGCIALTSFGSA